MDDEQGQPRAKFHTDGSVWTDGWKVRSACATSPTHFQGEYIAKPHKAFRSARAAAQLDEGVTPHILRHTRGTWLAQAGVQAREAAASLGLTEDRVRTHLICTMIQISRRVRPKLSKSMEAGEMVINDQNRLQLTEHQC